MTSASERIIDYIIAKGWTELDMTDGIDFSQFFGISGGKTGGTNNGGKPVAIGPTKTKGNSHKYVCPCCRMIVRATKIVNVKCGDCDETMIEDYGKQSSF